MLICTTYLTVMRRKIKFLHIASGNQECSHLKNKKISFLEGSCCHWKGNAYRAQQGSNILLVIWFSRPSVRSHSYLPDKVLLCTWLILGTQRGLSRGSLSGVGGDHPCRTCLWVHRSIIHTRSGSLFQTLFYKLEIPFLSQMVENQIYNSQWPFL